jgi:predicted AAA+ superfamily ATPase
MDLSTLTEQNIWWQGSEQIILDPTLAALKDIAYVWESDLLQEFLLDKDLIYILKGPRQVGKTTLLKTLAKKLLERGIFHRNIFYFSCNLVENYSELVEGLDLYLKWIHSKNTERVFVFLDEISFVEDWQRGIKHLADLGKFRNATLILTGSQQQYFKQIARKILESMTTPISWQSIFKATDIGSHNTVIEYIHHLESSFIISLFYCLDMNSRQPAFKKTKNSILPIPLSITPFIYGSRIPLPHFSLLNSRFSIQLRRASWSKTPSEFTF